MMKGVISGMSAKVRVSYTNDEELAGVMRLLSPVVKRCKIKPGNGRFKLAYIFLQDVKPPRGRTARRNRKQ